MGRNQTPIYLRWLWWKHTWHFQAAHKPLCARFHQDVLRIGRLHLCRSCAALYGGLGIALFLSPLYVGGLSVAHGIAVSFLLALVLVSSTPPLYRSAPRWWRDLLRGGLGTSAGISTVMLASPAWPLGAGHLAALTVAWPVYQHLRHQQVRQRDRCAGCPEQAQLGICSGFQHQAAHIRAYEESATDWLEQRMIPPSQREALPAPRDHTSPAEHPARP